MSKFARPATGTIFVPVIGKWSSLSMKKHKHHIGRDISISLYFVIGAEVICVCIYIHTYIYIYVSN